MSVPPGETGMSEAGANGPIESYLDELVSQVGTSRPRELRALLAETEAHLRDAADDAMARGLDRPAAELDAVARFGPATDLAAAERATWVTPLPVLARQVIASGLLLGGIGAVAVGISGLISWLIWAIGGQQALVSNPSATDLSAGNCARGLGVVPGAGSCRAAAMHDWADEIVFGRIGFGLLGLLAIGACLLLRRHWQRRSARPSALPALVSDTIGTAAFGAAWLVTLGLGVDATVVSRGDGSGQWLSAAIVAMAGTAVFGARLVRDLRHYRAIA